MRATGHLKPRPGVEEWTNPLNGFHVLQLHYSADPAKRTEAWKRRASRGMHPRAWRREYEIDWASPEGEPVVPEYDEALHCRPLRVDRGLRLLRFWDFGFDSPVVLFAQLTVWDQLRVLRELCPFNTTLFQLIPAAEAIARELLGLDAYLGGARTIDFNGRDGDEEDEEREVLRFNRQRLTGVEPVESLARERPIFDAGDPEATSRKSLGVESQVMGRYGLKLHTIRPGTAKSYGALRERLLRTIMVPGQGRQPALVIAPECVLLRQALAGAFCKGLLPPYKPKKIHPYKDLVDALRYGNDNLDMMKRGGDKGLQQAALQDIHETRV